jgi:hypothetical protein
MIAALLVPVMHHVFRTQRSSSTQRSYLCTFLNEEGESVDVFEDSDGDTFFLVHRRGAASAKSGRMLKIA